MFKIKNVCSFDFVKIGYENNIHDRSTKSHTFEIWGNPFEEKKRVSWFCNVNQSQSRIESAVMFE